MFFWEKNYFILKNLTILLDFTVGMELFGCRIYQILTPCGEHWSTHVRIVTVLYMLGVFADHLRLEGGEDGAITNAQGVVGGLRNLWGREETEVEPFRHQFHHGEVGGWWSWSSQGWTAMGHCPPPPPHNPASGDNLGREGRGDVQIYQGSVVGKLLLKSSWVTLLQLLVKLATFNQLPIFNSNGSVTVTSYWYFKCNEVVTSYYKK